MKSKKATQRALLSSLLSLLLCCSMLLGTTFAWFTDSVTSTGNIIKSGTLDVEMYWADGKADPNSAATIWKDASAGAIFDYDLWEPGYAEVRHIMIKNAGTLALKYQLGIKATGEVSKLTDVIDVHFADPAVAVTDRAMLTSGNKVGTLTNVLAGMPDNTAGTLKASEAVIVTLGLKMWESAGNEYQNLSVGSSFAVQLLATQLEAEIDSFDNQYDKGAVWDGTIPTEMPETLVVDTENYLISVNDPAAFAYLNTLVNSEDFYDNYGSKWKYTIELNDDINLFGEQWTPIMLSNFVAFEGNGHTISNLNVSAEKNAGLFSVISSNDTGTTYVRDLTIDGADVRGEKSVGVLVGSGTNAIVENVTVNDATVVGVKYVGGIFGSGNGSVNNSTVKNSEIIIDTLVIDESDNSIDSKEAGGLIGYVSNDGNATTENKVIANNTVENVTITAPSVASGLVAQPNSSNVGGALIEIKNNTMKNVTITTTHDESADLYVSNNVGGKSIVENNTAVDCKIGVGVSTAEDLANALTAGSEAALTADIDLMDSPIVIAAGAQATINLNGKTLSGVATSNTTSNLIKVPAGAELTLKNGTVSFAATTPDTNWGGEGQPAYPGYANNTISNSGKLIIDGATIENLTAAGGASYAIDCYPGSDLVINSGTIKGYDKVAIRMFANSNTVDTKLTINGGDISGRRGIWIHLPSNDPAKAMKATLEINGGTVTALDDDDCAIYSYSYGNSFADTNVTINGGTFNGDVCFGGGANKETVENVAITGGAFNGELGRYLANDGWEDIAKP